MEGLPVSRADTMSRESNSATTSPRFGGGIPTDVSDSMEGQMTATATLENAKTCALCGCNLGKRHFNRRHHCRICGFSVCDACSPNSVQLTGLQGVHRACSQCVAHVEQLPEAREALARLGTRLSSMATGAATVTAPSVDTLESASASYLGSQSSSMSLSDMLDNCQKAMTPLERNLSDSKNQLSSAQNRADQLHGKVQLARAALLKTAHRLRSLSGLAAQPGSQTGHLNDAIDSCESALKAFEASRVSRSPSLHDHGADSTAVRMDEEASVAAAGTGGSQSKPGSFGRSGSFGMHRPPARPLLEDEDVEAVPGMPEVSAQPRPQRCKRLRKCMGMSFLVVLVPFILTAVLAAAGHFWVLPSLLQAGSMTASLSLLKLEVTGLGENASAHMVAVLAFGNVLPGAIEVSGFRAHISVDGKDLAWCYVNSFAVKSSKAAELNVTINTDLHILDKALFSSEVAHFLYGEPNQAHWHLRGKPNVKAAGVNQALSLDKSIEWTPPQVAGRGITPEEVLEVENLSIVGSNSTALFAVASARFFSPAALEMHDVGEVVFSLHPSSEDGEAWSNLTLATVVVPNFRISPGQNVVDGVQVTFHIDSLHSNNSSPSSPAMSENNKHLGRFIGRWAAGMPQRLALLGPIHCGSPFVEVMSSEEILAKAILPLRIVQLAGAQASFLTSALVSSSHSIAGHLAPTGGKCVMGLGPCLRGPVLATSYPGIGKNITLKNINLDVNLEEDLAYDATLRVGLGQPKKVSCNRGRSLMRMFSAPGMWSYINPARSEDDFVLLPHRSYPGTSAFFLPSGPQPSQIGKQCLGPPFFGIESVSDCCFSTVLSAAACRQEHREQSAIPTVVHGNATMIIGDLKLLVEVPQTAVPFTFAEDIPSTKVDLVSVACEDFVFH